MRLETILDAMLLTADADKFLSHSPSRYLRAMRQYHAFRDRILRMNAEKDEEIRLLLKHNKGAVNEMEQLDKRIAELEDWINKPILEGGGKLK